MAQGRFELRLGDGRVVTWTGKDGADAARRYVDAHADAVVVATRSPMTHVAPVHPEQVVG